MIAKRRSRISLIRAGGPRPEKSATEKPCHKVQRALKIHGLFTSWNAGMAVGTQA
jgi:hypothetical protein